MITQLAGKLVGNSFVATVEKYRDDAIVFANYLRLHTCSLKYFD